MANDETNGTKTDPTLMAVDADLLALEGQLRDADFDRTRAGLRTWLERKDAPFPRGENETCGIEHEYHSGDASKTRFLIVDETVVVVCGRAVASFHKARYGLEWSPKLWATREEAEKALAERRQRREAQDSERDALVQRIKAAWQGKELLPVTRDGCGFDHDHCGENRGGVVVIENDTARVVALCGLAYGAYKASEVKWGPIFRTRDEAQARAEAMNARRQAEDTNPEERVKRLREFVARVKDKVEAGCAASEEVRRYNTAKAFLVRIDASRQRQVVQKPSPQPAAQLDEPAKPREQRRRDKEERERRAREEKSADADVDDADGMKALERGMRRNGGGRKGGGGQPGLTTTGKQEVTLGDTCPALAALRAQLPQGAPPTVETTAVETLAEAR